METGERERTGHCNIVNSIATTNPRDGHAAGRAPSSKRSQASINQVSAEACHVKSTRDSSFCPSRSSAVMRENKQREASVLFQITAVEIASPHILFRSFRIPIGSNEKLPISYVIYTKLIELEP